MIFSFWYIKLFATQRQRIFATSEMEKTDKKMDYLAFLCNVNIKTNGTQIEQIQWISSGHNLAQIISTNCGKHFS